LFKETDFVVATVPNNQFYRPSLCSRRVSQPRLVVAEEPTPFPGGSPMIQTETTLRLLAAIARRQRDLPFID